MRGCEKVNKACSELKADPKEALLDWFGVGVKAQEICAFVKRMELLAERVSLHSCLRLLAGRAPTPPCAVYKVGAHIAAPQCPVEVLNGGL